MTRKEWIKQNYPNMLDEKLSGGVLDCPDDYDDMPDNDVSDCDHLTCEQCWNKKMKERK